MRSLMTLAVLMPMTFAVAQAAPVADRQLELEETHIQPFPYPRHCPEGTHRAYDEYAGGYICVKDGARGPRPLPWHTDRMKELGGALGGDDMSAKGAALNGLFDAVQSRKTGADAVSAGAWGAAPSGVAALKPYNPKKGAGLIRVGEEGAALGGVLGGATGAAVSGGTGAAIGAPIGGYYGSKGQDAFNKGVEDLGNKLRDRNDEKLRQGTQAQKDAEEKYKKK